MTQDQPLHRADHPILYAIPVLVPVVVVVVIVAFVIVRDRQRNGRN